MINSYKVELFNNDELITSKIVSDYLEAWSTCNDWIMTDISHSFKITNLMGGDLID